MSQVETFYEGINFFRISRRTGLETKDYRIEERAL